jgi:hypothetical protein
VGEGSVVVEQLHRRLAETTPQRAEATRR